MKWRVLLKRQCTHYAQHQRPCHKDCWFKPVKGTCRELNWLLRLTGFPSWLLKAPHDIKDSSHLPCMQRTFTLLSEKSAPHLICCVQIEHAWIEKNNTTKNRAYIAVLSRKRQADIGLQVEVVNFMLRAASYAFTYFQSFTRCFLFSMVNRWM